MGRDGIPYWVHKQEIAIRESSHSGQVTQLTQTIKELEGDNKELKKQIEELEKKNEELKKRIEELKRNL